MCLKQMTLNVYFINRFMHINTQGKMLTEKVPYSMEWITRSYVSEGLPQIAGTGETESIE
jgi:hypothetical protein